MRELGLFIDGAFGPADSGETHDSLDPSTGEVVARVALGGPSDVSRAIGAARRAFDEGEWPRMQPAERARIMLEAFARIKEAEPEIAELESADAGHTMRMASLFSVPYANDYWRVLAELGGRLPKVEPVERYDFPTPAWEWVQREPFGVCGAIIPWNVPYMMAIWKLAPALVTGNTVVLKPALETPVSALRLAEAIGDALPPGVLNIVPGHGASAGEALVSDPRVDKVAFTGSTEVGRRIMQLASGTIKKVTLELGGKGPSILLDDADLDLAVRGSLWAMFLHSGQICHAGTRMLVPSSLYDETIARVVEMVEGFTVGPAADFASDLGPLVNETQLRTVERYVELGREEGAKLLTGGERLTGGALDRGWFFAPTVFGDVQPGVKIEQEEIFGPVLAVIRYETVEDAIRIANDSVYGLSAGVFSRDVPRALGVVDRLRAGTVWVNDWHLVSPAAPFGGYKQSGIGREQGLWGLREYQETKYVRVSQEASAEDRFWHGIIGLD